MKTLARGLAVAAVALGILALRVVVSSRAEYQRASASSGELRRVHLGLAARLYAPGNPWSRRALDELAAIGRSGSGPDALAAWREVRSAILATRSFYTPDGALLDEANGRIADLTAAAEGPERGTPAARRAWHAARLAEDDAPSVGWTLVALVGLGAWIGAAVGFFFRAVDERDRLRARAALAWAAGVAIGLILFFVGLARA
jgi:hypothetical protein